VTQGGERPDGERRAGRGPSRADDGGADRGGRTSGRSGSRFDGGSGDRTGGRSDGRGGPGRGSSGRGRPGRGGPGQARDGRGEQGRDGVAMRGGPRLAPKQERKPEPAIDEDVTGFEIDRAVKNELRTLSKDNAKGVGQHLVMVARLLDADVVAARAHAETAVRRAGRVAAVRETRGLVAYREADYQLALSEFRTARRLSGSQHLLPLMVDCERGLGRPERALELAGSPEARTLGRAERIELLIVCSGIRRDMGDLDAAVVLLETPELNPNRRDPWSARLFYAYAAALLERGDRDLARAWFAEAADADSDVETDAAERLDELDGVVFVDLGGGDEAAPEADPAESVTDPGEPVDVEPSEPGEADQREPVNDGHDRGGQSEPVDADQSLPDDAGPREPVEHGEGEQG